jgi:membrane-bound ClpP family serine protease
MPSVLTDNINFLTDIFHPLRIIYFIIVHIPLVLINGFYNMFIFFTQGFADVIFGVTINPDGSYSYHFDWNSQFGTIIIFIFVIALFMFFVVFLLSWGNKDVVDSAGRNMGSQSGRFAALR